MLESGIKALVGIGAITAGWLFVISLWRRAFPDAVDEDGDVLAGRMDCHNCGCRVPCLKAIRRKVASKRQSPPQEG